MRLLCLVAAMAASLPAQTASPNASGISIGHIHLIVGDPDAQRKLFVDMLGGEVKHAGPLEMWKFPGALIVIQKARTAPADGSDGSTVNHFGFLVKSYPEIKAKLTAAGVPFSKDNPQNKQVTAIFPEKILVEFSEDATIDAPIKFHHIHVATTDQEGLRDWYVKTFGGDSGKRGIFPAAKFPGGEVDFLKAAAAPAPTKGRTLDHIGFEVKNLEEFCKKLDAQGVTFDMKYREMPQLNGLKIAFVVDPVGTRIELTEGQAAY
jgi:catechol 2,3-dioxygenase-like lactoylglutathione lyase family enzyme